MTHKSKTQRAKASAARQQRKKEKAEEKAAAISPESDGIKPALTSYEKVKEEKSSKINLFKKSDDEQLKAEKKAEAKSKKVRFKFLKDVRAEMRRVTWPSRTDVLRWTGVVVVALLFFGVFVAGLDNLIVTPLLVALSALGA